MSYLQLRNLVKVYGGRVTAVEKINLDINEGEFVVLLGPSGCGKTTTMRMIAGLEDITEGEVRLDGEILNDLLPKDRNISMIFQSYAIWPHMTVEQNIMYPLKLKKIPKNECAKIIEEVAKVTDIGQYLKRYPSQLSGGQRQRVAVARAIAVKPKIFLMDEPLSNLDAKLRVSMRTKLKEIHQNIGATTIFVTHDQSEAMSLADKVVVMNMGIVEQIGSPMEIYSDCSSMFVANFIGAPPTNFFEGTIDNSMFKSANFSAKIVNKVSENCENVVLGIRPESMSLDEKGNIEAKIHVVEPQGSHTILTVGFENDTKYFKVITNVLDGFSVGQTIKLSLDMKKAMFFDKKTEKRIR